MTVVDRECTGKDIEIHPKELYFIKTSNLSFPVTKRQGLIFINFYLKEGKWNAESFKLDRLSFYLK